MARTLRAAPSPPRIAIRDGVRHANGRRRLVYAIHPDHRNDHPRKSQWTISRSDEIATFDRAAQHHWLDSYRGWGLHIVDDSPRYLGRCVERSKRSFIAKFVGASTTDEWHGYPGDYARNSQDIPPPRVLQYWTQFSILSPAQVRRIAKAQPCRL